MEKFGAVTTLNIDRQKTRNSLDEATLREMTEAINAFEKDAEAKVLVFNGEGGSFCSGFDLDEVAEKGYSTLTDAAVSSIAIQLKFFLTRFVYISTSSQFFK